MSTGERGPRGDRGPTGDHGQVGDTGDVGEQGETGEQGRAYSSWLTRHVAAAYVILFAGMLLAFVFTEVRHDDALRRIEDRHVNALERIDARARQLCEVGNTRSRLQLEAELQSRRQAQTFDFAKMFNVSQEQGEEFRRLSRESSDRRIRSFPFLDCNTGQRLEPMAPPP